MVLYAPALALSQGKAIFSLVCRGVKMLAFKNKSEIIFPYKERVLMYAFLLVF